MGKLLLSALWVVLFSAATMANLHAETLPSEHDFLGDVPVVLSASRLKQSLQEAPSAMTVIDRDMIKSLGVRQIHEALRVVPGFYVSYYRGNWPIVSYHGLGSFLVSRIQVLVDGRSIANPVLGGIDWLDLPISVDDVERIEVVRGPSTPAHGVNAFLAVVNIITRHASMDQGASIKLTSGAHIADAHIRYGATRGNTDYRMTLGLRSDDGLTKPYLDTGATPSALAIKRADTRTTFANLRVDHRLNNQDSLHGQVGWSGGPQGLGNRASDKLDPDREVQYRSHFMLLDWNRAIDTNSEFKLKYHHYYRKVADAIMGSDAASNNRLFAIDDSYTSRRDELEAEYIFSPATGLRVVLGAGLRWDRVDAPMTLLQREENNIGRLFGHAEWRPNDWWTINLGMMGERNSLVGTDGTPRFAVNFHADKDHTLRYSFSKALRAPSIYEARATRHFDVNVTTPPRWYVSHVGGGDAMFPESIVSREVGYIGKFPAVNVDVDVKVFEDRVENIITTRAKTTNFYKPAGYTNLNPTPALFSNMDWADQWGYEVGVNWRPSNKLHLQVSWSRLDIDSPVVTNDEIKRSGAPDTYRFFGSYEFDGGWKLSGFYQYEDEVRGVGGADYSGTSPLTPTRRWDVQLAKKFALPGAGKGELSWITQNVFDELNYGYRGNEVNFGRRSYVTLDIKL